MPPRRRLGPNAPPDDNNPHSNLPPSFPARFMSVLELYRAQRDTLSQVQAAPPSPTFRVQYQPDAPPVHHTLFAILSSQATVVAQEEFDTIREAVPSPPETPSPETILEAVEQVWAALRAAVPVRGSSINYSISRSLSFAEARESIRSGASSPMDNLLTHASNMPLFLAGSTSEGQLSASYHPQSIEVENQLPHVIGDQQHPISVHSSSVSDHQAITSHLASCPASLNILEDRLTPTYHIPPESYNATLSLRSLASIPIRGNSIEVITGQNDCYFEAVGLMDTIKDELNQAAEGHSHYFLKEPLTILQDPAFPVQSDELQWILDLTTAALSVGPHTDNGDDVWSLLRPSDWFRAATHTMAAILRGCVCTRNIGCLGNFPLHPLRNTYRRSNNLPELETQCDLLEAISLQIAEHLSLDNGPYLPQDSIDGIRATVWCTHKAQIRAAVSQKANEVEHKLTTLGLAELIDNLLNEASIEEITNTVREDIALQTRSKYNNAKLEAENKAYHEMINQAMAEGKDRAANEALETYAITNKKLREMKERQAKDNADKYYQNLLSKAKEQACLKADSEFARLLADKRSAIAPRVDAEIALEHKKLVEEHRLATEAQLKALTTEEEKTLVRVAASRLRMTLQVDEHTAKKVKVDQCKARPAPVTPRGRSSSIVSNTSQSNTRKRAYSPSEVIMPVPQPDRDDQKTPTPPKEITTVNFEIKDEPTPQPSFATPAMPSVIREVVDLAQSVSLRGSTSSIHNAANHMSVDPEHLDLANIFPPGIPPFPINVTLPPAMLQTPQFGGAEAHEDGVAPSVLPEVMEANTEENRLFSLMQKFNQPIWGTIHRIEQALGVIPRIPQRAGPGYQSEHTNKLAARVPSVPNGPEVMTQESRERQVSQAAPPFPSEPPVPEWSLPLATPIARVDDDDEFPALGTTSRGTRRRHNTAQANMQQEAVACQQNVQQSAAQARAVHGRQRSRKQGTAKPTDGNLTKVTVICFGGLDNEEEERKFRARNPVEIIQSVQCNLARQAKNPPAVLSGRWSTTANTTGNFVYTITGIIPPRDLMSMKPYLCRPFKGQTELVPTKGWTWIQLRQVPTEDLEGCVWGAEDLLSQFIANPCFQDALICIVPHWQGNLLNNEKEQSTVLVAIIDEDNSIFQNALTHGIRMFRAQMPSARPLCELFKMQTSEEHNQVLQMQRQP
ncbi:hypothetical protein V8E53_000681 [Lactarius tabidus]